MKTFSQDLLDFLKTVKSYNRADLFSIVLPNGSIVRAASGSDDINFNGNIYYSTRNGAWQRGKITSEAAFDMRANDMELTVLAPGTITFPAPSVASSNFFSTTIDKIVTNTGVGLTATVTGAPSTTGELALLIEANGVSNNTPAAPSPGSWTFVDAPNGGSHSSMYDQLLSSTASISPSQTLSGSSDTWAHVLIFFGSSTGSVITIPHATSFISGAFGAGNHTASFSAPTAAGSGVLVVLCTSITTGTIAPTVTDTAGNVYQLIAKVTSGSGASIAVLWSPNVPVGNPTMTFNLGSGSVSGTAKAYEVAGIGPLSVINATQTTTATLMAAAQFGLFDAALVNVWTARWPIGQKPPVFNGLTQLASDGFNRANQNPANTNWQSLAGSFVAGQVFGNQYIGQDGAEAEMLYDGGIVWPNDQYSQARLQQLTANKALVVLSVRDHIGSGASNGDSYAMVIDASIGGGIGLPTAATIEMIFGGFGAVLASGIVIPEIGDIFRIQIVENVITCTQNGIEFLNAIDSSVASGKPGIGADPVLGVAADAAWDDWSGGLVANTPLLETKYVGFIKPNGEITRSHLKFEVADGMYLLNKKLPRNLIQASCRHTLFDTDEFVIYGTRTNCTLNPNNFKSGVMTVASGSTRQSLNTTATLGQAAPYFTQGYITVLTGQNAGLTFTIKQQLSTTKLLLASAMPLPLAIGDTFTAFAGCDKSEATCNAKFSNLVNFGGTPFVPNPEVAI